MVPEVEPVVSAFRARFAAASIAKGIPTHITLLIPYVPAARLDDDALSAAREHFRGVAPFAAELVAVGRFEEHVWLAPSPRDTFVELIRATCRRYPESSYGTEFPDPVPHLTIGQVSPGVSVEAILGAAEAEIAPHLPVAFGASTATLLEEQANGTWASTTEFPFAS